MIAGMRKNAALIFITILAIATRFFYFNFPNEVVFDEVHFGTYVRSYFTGERYFDVHPPLGKLLIAGVARMAGFSGADGFRVIGEPYNAKDLFALRILPALLGALLVPLVYLFVLAMTRSRFTALIAGIFVLFDNALITQSRFALLDIPLIFFGLLALLLFVYAEQYRGKKWGRMCLLVLTGVVLGVNYSIKWTGLATALLIGVLALHALIKNKENRSQFVLKLGVIYLTSFLVYVAQFPMHFALLPKPGPGDAYVSSDFRQKSSLQQFIEMNKKMYSASATLISNHPFQSKWYQWPFMRKTIYYWQNTAGEEKVKAFTAKLETLKSELAEHPENAPRVLEEITALQGELASASVKREIWLTGNPVVWLLGLFSIVAGAVLLALKYAFAKFKGFSLGRPLFFLIGWAVNFFPFTFLSRSLFLYHYLFALIFSVMLFSYFLDYATPRFKKTAGILLCVVVVAGFLFVAPVSYGLPLAEPYHSMAYRFLLSF